MAHPANNSIPRSGLHLEGARAGEALRAWAVAAVYRLAAKNPALGKMAVVAAFVVVHHGTPGLSERSVHRWLAQFERNGLSGLADSRKGKSGRKPKVIQ